MKVRVNRVGEQKAEEVVIHCMEITPEVKDIYTYVSTRGAELTGWLEGIVHMIPLKDVLYFEAVDERVFAYTRKQVYEVKRKLYEVEEAYGEQYFLRCSKSIVLNLHQLTGIKPALNSRFTAKLKNEEEIIINRSYVPKLKEIMKQKVGKTDANF